MVIPPSVPPQSSFLSSSDDGDTEVILTPDIPSSVRFSDDDISRKEPLSITGNYLDSSAAALTRSRSLLALSEIDSTAQNSQLFRVKSFPDLKPRGDKHVRFKASQTSNVDSTHSGISGIDSKPSRGVCWSSSRPLPIKSKEIYVNFSYFSTSKQNLRLGLSMTKEDGDLGGTSEEAGQAGNSTAATEGQLDPALNECGNSLTASANGEIMGVSAVNSDISPDPHDLCSNNLSPRTNPNSMLGTKSETSLPIPPRVGLGIDKPPSLPTLTTQHTPPPRTAKLSPPRAPNTTKPSLLLKTSPYRHTKKRVTIPSQGGQLHESSVFSSTRYGPIVSAAESTTLSCVGSEQDVTDSTSSASMNETPVPKDFATW